MKCFAKLTAALLAVTIALTACGGDTSWVYRNGDDQVSAGLYILYQIGAFSKATDVLAEANKDNAEYTAPEMADILKTAVEGKPGTDYVNDTTRESALMGFAVNKKFGELGLSLTDANNYSIESSASQALAQMPAFYEKNGISEASLRAYYTIMAKRSEIFLKLYGEGGEFAVPEDEIKNYLKDKYAMVDIMVLEKPSQVPEGDTRTLEELTEDVREAAEGYKQMLADGQEIEQLAYDWVLKNTEGAESEAVARPEKGELRMILSDESRQSYGDVIVDEAFSANVGEPKLIEDTYYFLLILRSDILSEPDVLEGYRTTILSNLRFEEYLQKLAGWGADIQVETNNTAINRYKPSKIDFNAGTAA